MELREIILGHKQEQQQLLQKKYVHREGLETAQKLFQKHKDLVTVVTGPRRAGKSVFCLELLRNQSFAYINFDDERLLKLSNYDELMGAVAEVYGPNKTLLFDEIQNLDGWELFVNRLQRNGCHLIITGSNSNLLSQELATHLTGRHISLRLLPFSFREYLHVKQVVMNEFHALKEEQGKLKHHLEKYIKEGGYPEIVVKEMDPQYYLKTLFESILFKDIVKRHSIRFPQKLFELANHLITNHSSEFSYTSLKKFLNFRSVHTVEKYVGFLEEAFLIFKTTRFSYTSKERVKSPQKCYGIDTGLIEAIKFQISPDVEKYMENVVACELFRQEKKIYHYKTRTGKEIDFLIKDGTKITNMIQVCYDGSQPKTKQRELQALLQASEELQCTNASIITWSEEKTETNAGLHIQWIPLWKWLLNP